MNKIIEADLYRHGKLTGFSGFLKGMKIPGFRFVYFLRKANKHNKNTIKGMLARIVLRWLKMRYGFQINAKATIGKGFYIGHFGTILMGEGVVFGDNCNIAHSVTIGEVPMGKLKGVPSFGDKVWIGTGAVIVGKINIGSNVLIAPNSFVTFDVPSESTVIGNPARILRMNNNPTEGYIENILD